MNADVNAFLMFRLEVEVMDSSSQMFGSYLFALYKCLIDDDPCVDIGLSQSECYPEPLGKG